MREHMLMLSLHCHITAASKDHGSVVRMVDDLDDYGSFFNCENF